MRKAGQDSLPQTLRDALHDLVLNSPIPAKAQAEELGVPLSYLYNAANPELRSHEYQLRLLLSHTRITGNLAVMDFLERALGRVAVPLRQTAWGKDPRSQQDIIGGVLRSTTELGEVAAVLQQTMKDRMLTETETRHARKETWELLREVTQLYADLTQIEESFR